MKAYVREPRGSDIMAEILARPGSWGGLFVSDFGILEAFASLAKKLREKRLRRSRYQRARDDLARDYDMVFNVVSIGEELVGGAIRILNQHPARAAGAGDVVQLAATEHIGSAGVATPPMVLVCADRKLCSLAELRRIPVFDPERQPLAALTALVAGSLGLDRVPAGGARSTQE